MSRVLFFFNLEETYINTITLKLSMGRLHRNLPSIFLFVICSFWSPFVASRCVAGWVFRMISRCEGVTDAGTEIPAWKTSLWIIHLRHHQMISGLCSSSALHQISKDHYFEPAYFLLGSLTICDRTTAVGYLFCSGHFQDPFRCCI